MKRDLDVAVVGAGPYGLAVAARLASRRVAVFGRPLETWRTLMPAGMQLRATWDEMTLSAVSGPGDLGEWAASTGADRTVPMRVEDFIHYADWYREQLVRETVEANVVSVDERDGRLVVEADDETARTAGAVVLAVGVTPFPYVPEVFRGLDSAVVELAVRRPSYDDLAGKRVAVVGGGQTALEAAAMAAGAGAETELLVRSSIRWFADREPHAPRSALGRRLYRLAYPAVGYGPPPINRIVLHHDAFARLPADLRRPISRRVLRSGGSPWLRSRIDSGVKVSEHVRIESVEPRERGCLLRLGGGDTREVDAVVLGTGYRFDLAQLDFLAPGVRAGIALDGDWPRLDRCFRSSDPRILLVGYPSEGRFGPSTRFVLGAPFTAHRVAEALG